MAEIQTNGKVKITNIAPWQVSFLRKSTGYGGDVTIPANAYVMLDAEEVRAQISSGNNLFVGYDGYGAHARVIVGDKSIRDEFGIPDEQLVATDDILDKIFAYKQQATFEKKVTEIAVYEFEKFRIIDYIKRKKINEFSKVRFVETYVGVSIDM